MKKTVIISVIIAIFMPFSGVNSVYAASSDIDAGVDGGLSVGRCIQKGNLDFILFLNTLIFNDGFYDGIIEPWKDIFFRNKCHSTDISSLIKQQDKIRAYIRVAFLTCKNEKIPVLKTALEKFNIEIYYVRHVVDGTIVATLPFDLLSTRMAENPDSLYISKEKLYSDIVAKYQGKTTLSSGDLDLLFAKLDLKYKDKKKEYVICENGSWKRVAEKWKEFINTAGGLGPAVEKSAKEIGGAAEKLVESVNADSLKASYKGWLQVNVNNMEAEEGVLEIAEKLSKNVPGSGTTGTITQSALLDAIEISGTQHDIDKKRLEMSAHFHSLYRETSDAGTELLVTNLDNYNTILKDSFPILNKLLEGAKMMNNRQCPGKF